MDNQENKTPSTEPSETQKKSNKKKIIAVIAIIAVLAGGISAYCFMKNRSDDGNSNGMVWDTNAEEGGLNGRSEEEIQAELNKKVEEGMINISMNTSPTFHDGKSKGNLMIVNSEANHYPQIVYIIRKDTNEEIYRSGGIPVGSKVENAALSVDLPAGTYDCVAYFNNADPETGAILGTAGAEITITVEN